MFGNMLRRVLGQAPAPFRPGGSRRARAPCGQLGTCRPRLEMLETRLTPSGDFGFALSLTGVSANALATDRAGNVYVAGNFRGTTDFDPGPGVVNLTSAGNYDMFVAEYTRGGALAWVRQVGSSGATDNGNGIAVDNAGDVYVTGGFQGTANFTYGPGTFTLTCPAGTASGLVLKLDGLGNFVWARQFSGTGGTSVDGIAVDSVGNVYTAGLFSGTTDFDPGPGTFNLTQNFTPTSSLNNNEFLVKLDTGGNFLWARQFGPVPISVYNPLGVIPLALDGAGDVYLGGDLGVVRKLDAGGNVLWATPGYLAPHGIGGVSGIAVDSAGNVYTTGSFNGTVDFDPGPGTFDLSAVGFAEPYVAKLDSGGNFVWARQFAAANANSSGRPSAVALDGDGNVYTTGSFGGTVDFDPGPGTFDLTASSQTADAFVAKLDSGGHFVWARQFAAGAPIAMAGGGGIAVDPLGDVYTIGPFFGPVDFDPGPGTFNLGGPAGYAATSFAFVAQLRDSADRVPPTTVGVFDGPAAYGDPAATWKLRVSNAAGAPTILSVNYGSATSIPVMGDWNGDGTSTIGVVDVVADPNNPGNTLLLWQLRNSNTPGAPDIGPFLYGSGTDIPVVGDWDGNGTFTIGVVNPATMTWYLKNSNAPGAPDYIFRYGQAGDIPVVGDWDGNGSTTIGVVRPDAATGYLTWYLRDSNSPGAPDITPFAYGGVGDTPVVGDWNGDRIATVGVVDVAPSSAVPALEWNLRNSNSAGAPDIAPFLYGSAYGLSLPVPGAVGLVQMLQAAGGEGADPAALPLSAADLQQTVSAALGLLGGDGISPALVSRLGTAQFTVANLPAGVLGETFAATDRVLIDATAAGHGWFVDPTPTPAEDFAAAAHEDLLTAVLHEMGHLAGLPDGGAPGALMGGALGDGTRLTAALDAVFAGLA